MLAHQGGFDEVLLIVVPMLVVVGLLRLAKRRVENQQNPVPDVDDELPDDRA